ncbi:MAG: sugar phosphate isomerase/epimerase [Clostridia bacterium]|nr:sugar phosphate isomerase/epimerase [Clostridia bacterium]
MRKTGTIFRPVKGKDNAYLAEYIRSLGFDCVFTGYPSPEKVEAFAETFARAGLYYESIHAPFQNMNDIWAHGEEGEAMLAWLMACLEDCKRLNVPVMVVHLSKGITPPSVNDIGRSRWDRLVDAAVKGGVKIAFENQRFLANIAFVMELYRNVPQVGFCWDCGHENCYTTNIEFMKLFGDRLMYTHIHDNNGIVHGVLENQTADDLHLIPFDGNLNYNRFAEHIRNSGFDGTLTLELCGYNKNGYDEKYTVEQFLAKAYDSVAKLVKMCDGE